MPNNCSWKGAAQDIAAERDALKFEVERLQAENAELLEALFVCADLNIPYPDPSLPGGDTDFMRGVVKGHEEARAFTSGVVRGIIAEYKKD